MRRIADKVPKPRMIKLSKEECVDMEYNLFYSDCPRGACGYGYGCLGICYKVFPAASPFCPCHAYGDEAIHDAIIDLFEYNGYEISKEAMERYMKINTGGAEGG